MINDVYFDGANKYVRLTTKGTYTSEGIYSAWKLWASLPTNAGFLKAFDTIGGDAVGGNQEVAPYFFLRNDNGWRVKMPAEDGEIVISGNLFPRDPDDDMFEQTESFDAFLRLEVSTRAVVITVPAETGVLSVEQDALLTRLAKKVNLLVAG